MTGKASVVKVGVRGDHPLALRENGTYFVLGKPSLDEKIVPIGVEYQREDSSTIRERMLQTFRRCEGWSAKTLCKTF